MTIKYKSNALCMENVPLAHAAEKFGTPLYCYSAGALEENFKSYRDAMKRVTPEKNFTVCYAVKANGNVAVLKLLKDCGAGADVVSGGELYRALKAGISPEKIVYSGVGKTEAELLQAIKANIRQINVESESELAIISRIAVKLKKKVRIAIRVNPNVDAKTHKKITTGKKENKFGIDITLAPGLYKKAKALPGIDACGVAVHIGSQLLNLEPYRRAYTLVAELVKTLRKQGHKITTVDCGGGIGITYKNETPPDLNMYALVIRDTLLHLGVHIILEPGRSIAGNAGVLLSRVVNVKKSGGKTFIILDAAMNDLMRPVLYESYHAVWPCRKSGAAKITADIVGPVCETGDTFLRGEKIQPLAAGDYVALMNAGAYGASMSSNYNTRPLATEVMVKGGKTALVRRIQTVKEIVGADILPPWLE